MKISGEDPGPHRREIARQKRSNNVDCEYFKHFKGTLQCIKYDQFKE